MKNRSEKVISFDIKLRETAREWILKLFADKKFYRSAIYQSNEIMWDAIVKYEDDPYAFNLLEEDQFKDVFSAFCDDNVLVVANFPCILKKEHFVEEAFVEVFKREPLMAFTISKSLFNYETYIGINSQFSWIAFIDQSSGRTLIDLPELNFLIYP